MYPDLDEEELTGRCRENDRMAEEALYKRYAARIYTLCRRYSRDGEEAKDLMQETFLQALDKIQTYRYTGKGSLYGWISRIAINKAVNQIRRQRWRVVSLDLRSEDTVPDPTEDAVSAIPQEKLLEWISSLPDLRRSVFNLYCIDGYSHKEIGKMLGISEKGSAGVLAKARKQLKEAINQYRKETER